MSDDALYQLLVRQEIEELLIQYCRGVDRGDAELIRAVYHEDAEDNHGDWVGLGVDFADVVVEAMVDTMIATHHSLQQINLRIESEALAYGETYFLATHRLRNDTGETELEFFGGRYVDRFEKRNDAWKIARRIVVYEWSKIESPVRSTQMTILFRVGETGATSVTRTFSRDLTSNPYRPASLIR